jgi:hypothetical protein
MARGRPVKTEIREKLTSLLIHTNSAYGYELYRLYKEVFGPVSLRNIYYNLKKGALLGEFIIVEAKREPGQFTWGSESEHIYYTTGPHAAGSNLTEKQKQKLTTLQQRTISLDWVKVISEQLKLFDNMITDFKARAERLKYEDRRKQTELLKLRADVLKAWATERLGKNLAKDTSEKLSGLVSGL